jgi:prophage antirepressor-like protein
MSSPALLPCFPLLATLQRQVEVQYVANWRKLKGLTEEQKHELVNLQVRVFGKLEDPLYEAKAVCACLGIRLKHCVQRMAHLEAEEKTIIEIEGERIEVVNESGLFTLIVKSVNPKAKVFYVWLRKEVIQQGSTVQNWPSLV